MNVEYTGRQYEITPEIRKHVEQGLKKLSKILGDNFESKVILTVEKHRCKAEISVTRRTNPVVGFAEADDMTLAVSEALEHIGKQVVKHRARLRNIKRQTRKTWVGEVHGQELRVAVGASGSTTIPVLVHSFPAAARVTEAHVTRSNDSVALHPMTLEEAVKEAEFRDREVFVFRDNEGKVKVLHRKRDGKMELIEAP